MHACAAFNYQLPHLPAMCTVVQPLLAHQLNLQTPEQVRHQTALADSCEQALTKCSQHHTNHLESKWTMCPASFVSLVSQALTT
jgi:hypothetical protein